MVFRKFNSNKLLFASVAHLRLRCYSGGSTAKLRVTISCIRPLAFQYISFNITDYSIINVKRLNCYYTSYLTKHLKPVGMFFLSILPSFRITQMRPTLSRASWTGTNIQWYRVHHLRTSFGFCITFHHLLMRCGCWVSRHRFFSIIGMLSVDASTQ